jgi:REP element-mobilizing transposase RayT
MARDFDDNEFPLAYLITFRCYGTWLHGDDRGSMDPKHNVYGSSKIAPNSRLQESDSKQLKHPPSRLTARKRKVVKNAVREVCEHRKYLLRAINVRTNHMHTVVTAMRKPEPVLIAFQAYSTRVSAQAEADFSWCEALGATWKHYLSLEGARRGESDGVCTAGPGR